MALNGNIEVGTMPVIPDVTINLQPNEKYTILNGYHSGNSIIRLGTLAQHTAATATEDDIISTYRGWVNGQLVTGVVQEKTAFTAYTNMVRDASSHYRVAFSKGSYFEKSIYDNPSIIIPQNMIIQLGNITTQKIAKGKSYLGIDGTYTSDATANANDIKYGYIGYSNGEKIVGTLRTSNPYNVGIVANGTNAAIISWNNPTVGPFQGIRINMSITEYPGTSGGTRVYEGNGSSTEASARSSIEITNLDAGLPYYFTFYAYCGDLMISNGTNLEITI